VAGAALGLPDLQEAKSRRWLRGCLEAALAETVYLFGAGINRSISKAEGLSPPLANDLFQQARVSSEVRHSPKGGSSACD
jgi:hypothetical protein